MNASTGTGSIVPSTPANQPNADRTAIVAEFEVARPPERAWRALTDADLLGMWLMKNDIKPVVGHRFTFSTEPAHGWDGVVHCEVLVAEAPRRLSYTWQSMPNEKPGHPTRLDTDSFAYDGLGRGWNDKVLPALKTRIETLD